MKKRKLKKWVENYILGSSLIVFLLIASDCEDWTTFLLIKIVALVIGSINIYLLYNFENRFTNEKERD